jgi:hypothetical protein
MKQRFLIDPKGFPALLESSTGTYCGHLRGAKTQLYQHG